MKIERDIIEEIKQKNDIREIIGERVELNCNHTALCPFHEESKPSFSVKPSEQYCHCFGCGVGGDVIKFLQLKENMSFRDAITCLDIIFIEKAELISR